MVVAEAGYYCRPNLPPSIERLPQDESGEAQAKSLVLGPDELLSLRARIYSLYPDKRAVVSPSLSRLYISRETSVIDSGGTTTPNWCLFADRGVMAIVYQQDTQPPDLQLAMFQRFSNRLLWCLKWSEFVEIDRPTLNFHVIHSSRDNTEQHVGILYDNRDVAQLLYNSLMHLTQVIPDIPAQVRVRKKGILRSLSMKSRRNSRQETENSNKSSDDSTIVVKKKTDDCEYDSDSRSPKAKSKRRPLLKKIGRQRKSIEISPPPVVKFDTEPCDDDTDDAFTVEAEQTLAVPCRSNRQRLGSDISRETIEESEQEIDEQMRDESTMPPTRNKNVISRAGSAVRRSWRKSMERKSNSDSRDISDGAPESVNYSVCPSHRRFPFLSRDERRVSRTQSLKLEQTVPCVNGLSLGDGKEQSLREITDGKKLVRQKSRAQTDSLLLKGDSVRCVIDTGLLARQKRQRRAWTVDIADEGVVSTDLCVTEL